MVKYVTCLILLGLFFDKYTRQFKSYVMYVQSRTSVKNHTKHKLSRLESTYEIITYMCVYI